MKQYQNAKGSVILCTAALLWGLAFVAQSEAADRIPPFLFNSLRSVIGAVFLFAVLILRKLILKKPMFAKDVTGLRRLLLSGFLCGLLLTVSLSFQQFGLSVYPEGVAVEARAGFLTALYVLLVPLFTLLSGKKLSPPILIAIGLATAGIYLLCLSEGLHNVYLGDILVFLCAFSFTFHILAVSHYADVDGIALSMMQFATCAILSAILALFGPAVEVSALVDSIPNILYLGIVSSGIAYTMQIVGQKYAEPTVASLSMSLESVFAALGGWLILNNTLSAREFFGCALVFIAILLAQLPPLSKEKNKK